MTGIELATAVVGKAAVSSLGWFGRRTRRWAWKRRLARAGIKAVAIGRFTRRARRINRLIRRALGEQSLVESLSRQDGQAGQAVAAHLAPYLREPLTTVFGVEWESNLRCICRALSEQFLCELPVQKAMRLVGEGIRADQPGTPVESPPPLPPLVEACLMELSTGGEAAVAASLKQWMADPLNRRPDVVTEFMANTPVMLGEASFLAWETVGHFIDAYDLGDPQGAYRQAIQRGTPRRILYQVDEALRRFNGSNFADAGRMLDQLPQDQMLVDVARGLVDGDMSLVLARLERGAVCESEDPMFARFGKRVRIAALTQSGDVNKAIDLARDAIQEYPDFSSWRTMCGHLLAIAAQEERSDSARRRHLAEEGMRLAVEARDMIRAWGGPSGPAVAVALACAHLQHDPNAVCRIAARAPAGEATEHEASHPEVIPHFARALSVLERFDELRELDVSGLSEFDRTLIEAWLARHGNEPDATEQMRLALSLAEDEAQRSAALFGLASLGGIEDLAADAGLQQQPGEAALLASLASLERGALDSSLTSIRPYRWESPVHTAQYAHVLVERGEIDAAVDHFVEAATRFTAPEFLHFAAALLMERSRFEDAEPVVATALTRATETALRKILHGQWLEIANHRFDPSEMLQRAEAASAEFPCEVQFRWAVIVALVRQHDLQRAFRYLRDHSVEEIDRSSSLLAAGLRAKFDQSLETVDWLLEIAESHLGDEEFLAAVLGSIFEASQGLELSEHQAARLNSLVGGFLNEFPTSELFYAVEAPDIESLIEEMRATLVPGSVQRAETAEKVSLGQMPFGMMQVASGKPYALVLASGAAGALAAIPLDEDTRRQERAAAAAALDDSVAVDTSGIMLWQQHLDGSPSIMRCFAEIVVPTELLADLRAAEHEVRASASALGAMGIHPATGKLWVFEPDPEQARLTQGVIADILSIASGCSHVESTGLHAPDSDNMPSQLAPWDAAFRVALHRGCALWTDDAVMRALARHYGVPAFGTFALFEVLMSTPVTGDLPSHLDFKRGLIRSRVADVPLTWGELEAISEEESVDSVGFVLERPSSWSDPIETFRWFRKALSRLQDDDRAAEAPHLLFSATLGACRTTDKDGIPRIAGALLTAALLIGLPHELVPGLVAASRGACLTLTLGSEIDPLPMAASNLAREANERLPDSGGALIGQYVMGVFSGLEEDDLHIVSVAILGPRLD